MTQLETLQTAFQDALLEGQPIAAEWLSERGVKQFGIYQNAYRARLRGALRDNFEVLPLVMGDESFDALANAYIDRHPSRHYSLRWFGHQLCEFMAANDSLVDHPAMLDLARMEWALRHAFDAAPAESLSAAVLAAVPPAEWAELRLALHPSVRLLDMQWAVGPVWHALKSGHDNVAAPQALDHHMMVWRHGTATQWKSLTRSETVFAQCLLASQCFGKVCEALAHDVGDEHAAATAADLLSRFLSTGALGALSVPSSALP
jgi:hypothetical protein